MNDVPGHLPPAGWYPDGVNEGIVRWWNGLAWTAEVRQAPAAMPAPVASVSVQPAVSTPTPSAQVLTRRELRERYTGTSDVSAGISFAATESSAASAAGPTTTATADRFQSAYVPMITPWYPASASIVEPRNSSHTWPVWALALSPLWLFLVGLWLAVAFPSTGSGFDWTRYGISFGVSLGLAGADILLLRTRGFRTTSLLWVLLTPIAYLGARMRGVGRAGLGPLLTYVALTIASIVALVVLLVLVHTPTIPPTTSSVAAVPPTAASVPLSYTERAALLDDAQVENRLRTDLTLAGGWVGPLECAPFPSDRVGSTTACALEVDGVSYTATLVILPEQPYVPFVLGELKPVTSTPA